MRLVPLLLGLSACTLTLESFVAERNAVLCDLHVDCFGTYPDLASCQQAVDAFDEPGCTDFVPPNGTACLRLLREQAASCPTEVLAEWQPPATCAQVCVPDPA